MSIMAVRIQPQNELLRALTYKRQKKKLELSQVDKRILSREVDDTNKDDTEAKRNKHC